MPPRLCNQLHGVLWPGSAVYRPETVSEWPPATHPSSWETAALSRPVLHQLGGWRCNWCCFTASTETVRTWLWGTGNPERPPRLSHSSWVLPDRTSRSSSLLLYVHRDHKDVTMRNGGEPTTTTSTLTQLPSSRGGWSVSERFLPF